MLYDQRLFRQETRNVHHPAYRYDRDEFLCVDWKKAVQKYFHPAGSKDVRLEEHIAWEIPLSLATLYRFALMHLANTRPILENFEYSTSP